MAWKYSIKGWGAIIDGDEPESADPDVVYDYAGRRDRLVALLLDSDWYHDQGSDDDERLDSELGQAIQDLRDSPTITDTDQAIWSIYNLADDQRAWLEPDFDPDKD